MSHELRFAPLARADLISLHAWIEGEAGTEVADGYQERLEARCWSLTSFPHRGTPRDDLLPGVRTIPFERRIIIFYRVQQSVVTILRVVGGARNLSELMR